MSEPANVRVVRCPKCENLLPELTDYAFYQCGGCGAVLKAKNEDVGLDILSEMSNEERVGEISDKISDKHSHKYEENVRVIGELSDNSENDVRSSRAERRIMDDRGQIYRNSWNNEDENFDVEDYVMQDKRTNPLIQPKIAQDLSMYIEDENVSRRSERMMNWRNAGRFEEKVEYVGDDRAEILRKIEELKNQLNRSAEVVDKGKEKVPLEGRAFYEDPYVGSSGFNQSSMQYSYPDNLYQNRHPIPINYPASCLEDFEDKSRSQMLGRRPQQSYASFQQPRSHQYMDDNMVYMDRMEPYPPNVNRHHPSCPCFQCNNKRQAVPHVLPTAHPDDVMLNHHETLGSFGPRDYYPTISNPPPLRSRNPQLHTRRLSDINSEVGGFTRRHRSRVRLGGGGRYCRPIAGGAPFLTCYNCFELLQFPKQVLVVDKNRKKNKNKMICGVCSTLILYAISDKGLVVSIHEETRSMESPYNVVSKEGISYIGTRLNHANTTFSSEDYDNVGYDFQPMDNEFGPLSTREGTSSKSPEMMNFHSISSYTSETEEHFDRSRKDKSKEPSPLAGSPLQDYFEYSNKYHNANRLGHRNISGLSEGDKPSMKDSSSATEIDISANEYANTGTSMESIDASREGDRLRRSRAAESFFAGIVKKSFKDSSNQTSEEQKANVTVNGHLIPDRLIKKAEKFAGPIQPGNYWYDFRAGFWGEIGGHCLGIIPPFIEEFNYPMPENCAGGNTRVFVNSRELHQKDMTLLVSRGLPSERDKSYIIEISGRVLDKDTGQELESLGKLAPTVERAKRGFGMRVSKAAT